MSSMAGTSPTDLLRRLVGNQFGVRTAEYLVEADLGEQLGTWPHANARVEFDGVPVLGPAELPQAEDGEK